MTDDVKAPETFDPRPQGGPPGDAAPPPIGASAIEEAARAEGPPGDAALDDLAAAVHQSFLLKPAVQNWLPLGTSLAVHLAIILFALLTLQAHTVQHARVEEQIIVPDAAIVEGGDVGGIPNPGLGGDPTRASAQDTLPDAAESQGWSARPSQTVQQALVGGGETESASDMVIGVGSASSLAKGPGAGTGSSSEGGDLAPFGVPGGGGGIGPSANFAGISGNARRVVYICDATGTMVGLRYTMLKRELYKALDILKPIQGFNIIFFKGGDSEQEWSNPFARELLVANPANKQKARQFIDTFQVIGKGTNPLPALRTAFAQKPQLIYFLTDGEFDNIVGYKEVLGEIRTLNADKSVRINTIMFLSTDAKAEETLAAMAKENGGRFIKVTDRDLD